MRNIINLYNKISETILSMFINELNNEIQDVIDKLNTKGFDLTINGYKQYYTVMQFIENLKNN